MSATQKKEAADISIMAEDHRKTAAESLRKRKLTAEERALDPDASDDDSSPSPSSSHKKPRRSLGGDPAISQAIPKLLTHLEALGTQNSLAASESMALTKELIKSESEHHLVQGDHWREERAIAHKQMEARSQE